MVATLAAVSLVGPDPPRQAGNDDGTSSRARPERPLRDARHGAGGPPVSLRLSARHDAASQAVRRVGDGLHAGDRAVEHDARDARVALHGPRRERASGPLRRGPSRGAPARDQDAHARRDLREAGLRREQRRGKLRLPRKGVRARPRLPVGRRAAAPEHPRRDLRRLGARSLPPAPLPVSRPLAGGGHARARRGRDHGSRHRPDRPRADARAPVLSLRELLRRARAGPRPADLGPARSPRLPGVRPALSSTRCSGR